MLLLFGMYIFKDIFSEVSVYLFDRWAKVAESGFNHNLKISAPGTPYLPDTSHSGCGAVMGPSTLPSVPQWASWQHQLESQIFQIIGRSYHFTECRRHYTMYQISFHSFYIRGIEDISLVCFLMAYNFPTTVIQNS